MAYDQKAYDQDPSESGLHDDDAWYLIGGVFAAVFVAVTLLFTFSSHAAQPMALNSHMQVGVHVAFDQDPRG